MRAFIIILGASLLVPPTLAAQTARTDSTPPHPVTPAPAAPPGRPLRAAGAGFVDSLKQPESVLYDPGQDVWFISNIDGKSLEKDGKGSIARLTGQGGIESREWIVSGSNGVVLHAPKGMALQDTLLWVTDIDAVRAFDRRTGRPVFTVDLTANGATFLNDIAAGPDGALYVTDTRVLPDAMGILAPTGPGRIFRIARDRTVTLALESERLGQPNGITWDATGRRFILVPMAGDTLMSWRPGTRVLMPLAVGPGTFDGVTVTRPGEILVGSKATGSIHRVEGNRLGTLLPRLGDVADFGYAAKHGVLGIALTGENRVLFFRIAASPPRASP